MLQYQIDRIDHQIADDRSQTGTFLIGPLERGQATTLGNSLRRVLMGGLEGSAVTALPSSPPIRTLLRELPKVVACPLSRGPIKNVPVWERSSAI